MADEFKHPEEKEVKNETAGSDTVERRVMRPLGFYEVKKRGEWTRAHWSKHGWKVVWSNWYQNDDDLDGIRTE